MNGWLHATVIAPVCLHYHCILVGIRLPTFEKRENINCGCCMKCVLYYCDCSSVSSCCTSTRQQKIMLAGLEWARPTASQQPTHYSTALSHNALTRLLSPLVQLIPSTLILCHHSAVQRAQLIAVCELQHRYTNTRTHAPRLRICTERFTLAHLSP